MAAIKFGEMAQGICDCAHGNWVYVSEIRAFGSLQNHNQFSKIPKSQSKTLAKFSCYLHGILCFYPIVRGCVPKGSEKSSERVRRTQALVSASRVDNMEPFGGEYVASKRMPHIKCNVIQ